MTIFLALMLLQEGNPCQVPLTTVTDPRAIYAVSDQWGDPAAISDVEIVIVQNGRDEPDYRYHVPPSMFVATSFMGCARANFSPPEKLLRDGNTIYALTMRFVNSAQMVSPWSNAALFKLSAPTTQPPRAPALRLGQAEEAADGQW